MHVPNTYGVDVGNYFGPASHWKGFCDGKFGCMNGALDAAVAERDVASIEDYHAVLKEFLM